MAQVENFFALLGDLETDDVSELIDSLKVEEPLNPVAAALDKKKDQKPKQKFQMAPLLVLGKEKKDEQKPQENSNAKEPGKKESEIKAAATKSNVQQPSSDNGEKDKIEGKNYPDNYHDNGYHQGRGDYRVGNGYQGNYRNNSYGFDGYQGNYSRPDGYQVNNNTNNNGGYRGGTGGRGRGFQQRRFYENNGNERKGQAVAYGNSNQQQQEFYYGKEGQQYYGGYRGQGPRGYYRRDGSKYYNNGMNNGDKKSDEGNSSNNGDNKNDNFSVVPEERQEAAASNGGDSKEVTSDARGDKKSKKIKKKKNKSKRFQDKSMNKAEQKAKVDWKKLMTLKEYEESLLEKKKPLEALQKDWGRKVLADEEFGSMQIIGKKNEEKKYEEIKKDHSHSFEEEKVHKSMRITEFLKQYGDRSYYGQRPYGRGNNGQGTNGRGNEQMKYGRQEGQRPFYDGHRHAAAATMATGHVMEDVRPGGRGRGDDYDPHIEDFSQFPVLGSHGSA
ncbi:hypothetical protein CRYUN_Cryun21dG0098800 [Craigia yunnanensis]